MKWSLIVLVAAVVFFAIYATNYRQWIHKTPRPNRFERRR